MSAYMIVQIAITDEGRWQKYREAVAPLITRMGGKYVVRCGEIETLEGRPHDGARMVMFEFPSMDALHAFSNSPDYVPIKKRREGAAVLDIWAIEGI